MAFELLPYSFFTLPDGIKLRYAQFGPSGTPRGTVLALPGRREFIEKKHHELAERLLGQELRLIVVEMRGQGLSSRFLSDDLHQRDHVDNFSTYLNDLNAFYEGIVKPHLTGPLILHGHSMGGHLVLRFLADMHPKVAGAFVTAPMLALSNVPMHLIAHLIAWPSTISNSTHYAFGQHNYGEGTDTEFQDNVLTQHKDHFGLMESYFKAYPELTVGGVTWGWIWAALRSIDKTHSWGYLQSIDVPVLGLIGEKDRVTPASQIMQYLNRIPRVQSHIIADARHDLTNETELLREKSWKYIIDFINTVL